MALTTRSEASVGHRVAHLLQLGQQALVDDELLEVVFSGRKRRRLDAGACQQQQENVEPSNHWARAYLSPIEDVK